MDNTWLRYGLGGMASRPITRPGDLGRRQIMRGLGLRTRWRQRWWNKGEEGGQRR